MRYAANEQSRNLNDCIKMFSLENRMIQLLVSQDEAQQSPINQVNQSMIFLVRGFDTRDCSSSFLAEASDEVFVDIFKAVFE